MPCPTPCPVGHLLSVLRVLSPLWLFYEWQSGGGAVTAQQGGTTNPMPMQQSNEGLCDTESDLSEEAESELESDEISDDNDGF